MAAVCPWRTLGSFSAVCVVLLFDFISCDLINSFGVVNKSVILHPSSNTVFKEITWKKNKDKIVDWYEGSEPQYFPPFKERISLNFTSGDLTINNLRPSDEDQYEIQSTELKNPILFSLLVFEPLPSPVLNCTLDREDIKIQCEVPDNYSSHRDRITYSWDCRSAQCKNHSNSIISFKKEEDLSQEIQCNVINPVLTTNSSISLTACVPNDTSRGRWGFLVLFLFIIVVVVILGIWRFARRQK